MQISVLKDLKYWFGGVKQCKQITCLIFFQIKLKILIYCLKLKESISLFLMWQYKLTLWDVLFINITVLKRLNDY